MKDIKLISSWSDLNYIHAVCEVDGKRVKKRILNDWYFAVKELDYKAAKEIALKNKYIIRAVKDKKFPGFIKIHCQQSERYELVDTIEKEGIRTYEGDLSLHKRWYVDEQFEISKDYTKLYYDIETDDSIRKIEVGRDRIVSFAAIDHLGNRYFTYLKEFTDEGEAEMIAKIIKLFERYDILIGWNSGNFDLPYLKMRAEKFGLRKQWYATKKKRANFDLLKRFRHAYRFDSGIKSFALEYVSQHFLGKGKIKHDETIIELYKTNLEKLKAYNIEDCVLVKELDEKLKVTDMMINQAAWCHVPVKDFGLYSILDSFILETAHRIGKFELTSKEALKGMLPRTPHIRVVGGRENPDETDTEKKKYLGGLVLDPVPGLYKRVYVFDFKSLYPSMMKTSNIGHETLMYKDDGVCIINPGTNEMNRKTGDIRPTFFSKEKSTIFLAISEMLTKRKEYKAWKFKLVEEGRNDGPEWDKAVSDEIVVKELSNSMYGIMGLDYGRYFSIDIAESITLFGQWMIMNAKGFFESQGHKAIYGDTDSIFIATEEPIDVHAILDKYHEYLRNVLKEKYRIDECFIELEFDKEYDGFILIAKKTYCGRMINYEGKKTDKMYARGLEFIKRGTFKYATDWQKKLAEFLFTEPSEKDVKDWLTNVKKDFFSREFDVSDLTITMKIGKSLQDYNGKKDPVHVQVAKYIFNKTGQFYKNQEVEYIITGSDKGLSGVPKDEFNGLYDKNYYWENKTVPLLKRVTEPAFPSINFDELFSDVVSMFDF